MKFFTFVACFILCTSIHADIEDAPLSEPTPEMTLEQKVGQMFMIGFNGTAVSPMFRKHLSNLKPGAVIVFGRNIKSLKQISVLNSELQRISLSQSHVPLFIAVDQEGGGVARIRTSPALPSAYTIGQTNNPTLAFQAGKATGELLSLLGFNMNLAPVLDVTDDKLQSFIGPRSFSESPHKTGNMGVAFAHGLSEGKVLPVAKHFPGHGPISLDTHHTTPSRNVSLNDLLAADLIPFTQFASSGFSSGIMMAHISYPMIDASGLPATFSKTLVTDVLQTQLQYQGLVLTDDVEMGGAAVFKKLEDRAVSAVLAGNDLIMFGWDIKAQLRARNAIVKAVRSGKIPMERIDRSVSKIVAIKNKSLTPQTRSLAAAVPFKNLLGKIPFSQAYTDVFASYFKDFPRLTSQAHNYESFAVFSGFKSFSLSFRKTLKKGKTRILRTAPVKGLLPGELLAVLHVATPSAIAAARALPETVRRQTVVVSSLPNFRFENRDSFLEVVEIHSYHPQLGAFTADAINRAKTNFSLLSF